MIEVVLSIMAMVFSVIGYLLRQKDVDLSRQIAQLFAKHEETSRSLHELRIQIAREHYQKNELDTKFDKLEAAFKAGFNDLGAKFDKLSSILITHLDKEHSQ